MSWAEGKPSQNENEYFARRDAEWLKEQRARLDAKRVLHAAGIKCPRDGAELDERMFESVRVDVCPTCQGIWLDPGELEQLVHLSPAALKQVMTEAGESPR